MSGEVIGYVWYSQRQHYKSIAYRSVDVGPDERSAPEVIETMWEDKRGRQLLPRSAFPEKMFAVAEYGGAPKRHPNVFTNGFVMVSSKAADVLRQFDLGAGALYPVELFDKDRVTPVEGEFFYLTHGNSKDSFLPDKSPEAWNNYRDGSVWSPPPNPLDDQLFYGPSALEGPDIWREERTYWGLMMSDRLVQALKKAGASRGWLLLRCPVATASNGCDAGRAA
ncbi:MAG: hypothetical protein AAGF28_10225 [Pseudomonadota bacterium]